ncbi:TPA: hypothetical protein QFT71_005016 [Raoultella ornithinolytica]|nr:hypothetical protein [Raoultella ornithinolytica]
MEFGNIADWISALSTLGTFAVAYVALRNAPDWIAQKHYDIAHTIIEDSVFKDLRKVRSSSLYLKTKIAMLCSNLVRVAERRNQYNNSFDTIIDGIDVTLAQYHDLSYSIINQLKAISRTNYTESQYTLDIINFLKDATEKYNNSNMQLILTSGEVSMLQKADASVIDATIKEIMTIKNDVISINQEISDFIKKIYSDNHPVNEFICYEPKSKKRIDK